MISIVIATLNDAHRLTAALSPLVSAAMEGLVRELIVVDGGSDDETLEIADDAGARIIRSQGDAQARLQEGVAVAKGPWLLLLDPGVRLQAGWESAVSKHIDGRKTPARFRLESGQGGWLARLSPPKALALLTLKKAGGFGDAGGFGRKADLLDARGWV